MAGTVPTVAAPPIATSLQKRMKRRVVLDSAHGKPVVIVPVMVTHIASRSASECDVFLVGGTSGSVKGTAEEVAATLFYRGKI